MGLNDIEQPIVDIKGNYMILFDFDQMRIHT